MQVQVPLESPFTVDFGSARNHVDIMFSHLSVVLTSELNITCVRTRNVPRFYSLNHSRIIHPKLYKMI